MSSLDQIASMLNALLAAELGSPFVSAHSSSPYGGPGDRGQARKVIRYIAESDSRRSRAIATLMTSLGMEPDVAIVRPGVIESYLSLRHIAPQLLAAKHRILQAYRDATGELGAATEPIADLLRRHLNEHAGELDVLSAAVQC